MAKLKWHDELKATYYPIERDAKVTMVVIKVIKEKILKLHVSMKAKPYAFSSGALNHITHKVLHVSTDWCYSGTNNHQVPMFVTTKFLQAGFLDSRVFYKWSPRAMIYLQIDFINLYLFKKKKNIWSVWMD